MKKRPSSRRSAFALSCCAAVAILLAGAQLQSRSDSPSSTTAVRPPFRLPHRSALRRVPDVSLLDLDGNTRSTFELTSREFTVLSMASLSCPIFLEEIPAFESLAREFPDLADFAFVYSTEAHPTEELPQSTTNGQRTERARRFAQDPNVTLPVFVDPMGSPLMDGVEVNDKSLLIYGPDGQIFFQTSGPSGTDLSRLRSVLLEFRRIRDAN